MRFSPKLLMPFVGVTGGIATPITLNSMKVPETIEQKIKVANVPKSNFESYEICSAVYSDEVDPNRFLSKKIDTFWVPQGWVEAPKLVIATSKAIKRSSSDISDKCFESFKNLRNK